MIVHTQADQLLPHPLMETFRFFLVFNRDYALAMILLYRLTNSIHLLERCCNLILCLYIKAQKDIRLTNKSNVKYKSENFFQVLKVLILSKIILQVSNFFMQMSNVPAL